MIRIGGRGLQRVIQSDTFDAFPVFPNDGKKLIFYAIVQFRLVNLYVGSSLN